MAHEISLFDIPDRQLLSSRVSHGTGKPVDIGEAKITRTLFGGAKVRVIRELDKARRTWLLTTLLVSVIFVAVLQMWITSLQEDEIAPPPVPLSASIKVSAPVFQPAYNPPPENARSVRVPKSPTEILLNNLARQRPPPPSIPLVPKSAPQTVTTPALPAPTLAKAVPAPAQPAVNPAAAATTTVVAKPQLAPSVTSTPVDKHAEEQQPVIFSAPIHPAPPDPETSESKPQVVNSSPTVAQHAEPAKRQDSVPIDMQSADSVVVKP